MKAFGETLVATLAVLTISSTTMSVGQVATGATREETWALAQRAATLIDQGDVRGAVEAAEQAQAQLEARRDPVRYEDGVAFNNIAHVFRNAGPLARAESLLKRALQIYEATLRPDHPVVATALNNLASVLEESGRYGVAEDLYHRALAIDEKEYGAESPTVATTLNNLAGLYAHLGRYEDAERLLLRALAIDEAKLGSAHLDTARDRHNRADLYMRRGDYARAQQLFTEVLAGLGNTVGASHPRVAGVHNSLGVVRFGLGDYVRAEADLLTALRMRGELFGPRHIDLVMTLNNLGLVYQVTGRNDMALKTYERAASMVEGLLDDGHPINGTLLNNLSALLTSTADYDRAEALARRSLEIQRQAVGEEHPDVALAHNNIALVYIRRGDFKSAIPSLQQAIAIDKKALGPNHPTMARLLSNLAGATAANGDAPEALKLMSQNREVHEHNLGVILGTGSEAEKRAYLDSLLADTFQTISLHVSEAPKNADAVRLALTTILQRKGRALDSMADQITSIRQRLEPEDRELLDRLISVRRQLSNAMFRVRPAADGDDVDLRALEEEAETLERQLSDRSTEFGSASKPIALNDVQQLIPESAALVEIALYQPIDYRARTEAEVRGELEYVAYVLKRRGEPTWVPLGRAAPIDRAIRRLLERLMDPRRTDVPPAARDVDDMVMQPIRQLLDETIRHILLSPDGALNLVPFSALVDERDRYLLDTYTFTYLTSGRDLVRLQQHAPEREPPLIVANASFDKANERAAPAGVQRSSSQRSSEFVGTDWKPLAGTALEAKALASTLTGARLLTDSDATESALKAVHGPRILHIATHGFFLADQDAAATPSRDDLPPRARENPLLRSGLILAGANQGESGQGEDGVLTALEVAGLDLSGTRLVVLSACETGLGEVRNSEGVYGLRRALVLAGAEGQLVSLWRVDDEETPNLMADYYRRLEAGEGRARALREVQLARRRSKSVLAHPYYWAAFIPVGDDTPLAFGSGAAR